ncbi:MAG: phage major tail protein, TP901-1 family [Hyphomicrobiaceae bacterium]|nr:phage major tail protein, TP901-1 family [Hyphomicrobiaceae bacterium]
MAAQKGKDLLLKVDGEGLGSFTTVAGLRTRSLSLNTEAVDVTDADSSGQWRELLAGAGIRSARLSGAGIFKDAASDETVRDSFFNATIHPWQIVVPDFGAITGPFQISALEFAGRHDGEVTFDITLESAGSLVFAAL